MATRAIRLSGEGSGSGVVSEHRAAQEQKRKAPATAGRMLIIVCVLQRGKGARNDAAKLLP
jgi:hypothetical protein